MVIGVGFFSQYFYHIDCKKYSNMPRIWSDQGPQTRPVTLCNKHLQTEIYGQGIHGMTAGSLYDSWGHSAASLSRLLISSLFLKLKKKSSHFIFFIFFLIFWGAAGWKADVKGQGLNRIKKHDVKNK